MIDYDNLNKDISMTLREFKEDMNTDESREYRRGYYAGRLHALLEVKGELKDD